MKITRGHVFVLLSGDTMTGALLIDDGAVGAPGIAFASQSNTGWYTAGAGSISLAVSGTRRVQYEAGNAYAYTHWLPGTSAAHNLGAAAKQWLGLHLSGTFTHEGAVHRRTEAKKTAGYADVESVVWSVAFSATPIAATAWHYPTIGNPNIQVTSLSTTGATLKGTLGVGAYANKHIIAQEAT
tara:strand:- start:135 stop:683 length:549 start_codon:yes stop_codon:yes gene_type:complete